MNQDRSIVTKRCGNCGAPLQTSFCGQCGQNLRQGERLNTLAILRQYFSVLMNTDSAFWATFLGLARHPGLVCSEYVSGKRKKYVNPFVYVLIAATAQLFFSYFLQWCGWIEASQEAETGELPEEIVNGLLFLISLVIAFFLSRLFYRSKRNFAETYCWTLFIVGQLLWFDLICMPFFAIVSSESLEYLAMSTVWLLLATWAGRVFFSCRLAATFWRMVLATTLALIALFGVIVVLTAIMGAE